MHCQERLCGEVDEVRQILTDCQTKAIDLLNSSRASLDRIADYLLEKENITGSEFMELLAMDAKVA